MNEQTQKMRLGDANGHNANQLQTMDGEPIATFFGLPNNRSLGEIDARFRPALELAESVVHAYNAHDALLAAAENALRVLTVNVNLLDFSGRDWTRIVDATRRLEAVVHPPAIRSKPSDLST